ncbi:phytanoyl-CoA dioxygenase family protein [Paeniroseomonas aquatica]|uniref:Phytanoyl-CoA dioxygenase family protein n=1 Tax=Paeniroseomonas aquatica TaxID=373043 RepID=A0ABT8A340_9PROT|nr:phytanoyl-CoA dioxygenase family protein [Paeniroseomonas aquatica]MDN3563938.1 phytanoyl-CoA dioxygenase family protein [Paeniroseomonas aquatica]
MPILSSYATRPTACPQATPIATIRADYDRDGFAVIPGLADAAELAALRQTYDRLFESQAGWGSGDFFDMLAVEGAPGRPAGEAAEALRLPQLAWPSRYAPELAAAPLRLAAEAIGKDLLGPEAELVWEFAIMKPPRVGAPTPWHQDEASFTLGTPYRTAVSVWIPLQDTDAANGCMLYVPGSHRGILLPHESVDAAGRAHALRAVGVDPSRGVPVPLRAGDAVLHHSRTLHSAGPNTSAAPRRALTLEFAVKSKADMVRRDFAWNHGKRTAHAERAARALPVGQRMRQSLRRTLIRLGLR